MIKLPKSIGDSLGPLEPVWDFWMILVRAFSWVVVRVGLLILFITVFLSYGLILRILRKDPLQRGLNSNAESYWGYNVISNTSIGDFKKQY